MTRSFATTPASTASALRAKTSRPRLSLRVETLYIALGLVEAIWITPYFMLAVPGAYSLPGWEIVILVAGNLVGALALVRLLTQRGAPSTLIQLLLIVGGVVSVFITLRFLLPVETIGAENPRLFGGRVIIPPVAVTIIVYGLLWYRGSQLATVTATVVRASFGLRIGIVALMVAAFIPDERVRRAVLLLLPPFFFFGLIGTALARSASLRVNREVYRSAFGASWVGLTLVIGGALSIFGYVFALLLGGFRFDSVLGFLRDILIGIIAVGATLIAPLYEWFRALMDRFLGERKPEPAPPNSSDAIEQAHQSAQSLSPFAEQLMNLLPMLCIVSVLIILLVVILLRVRSRKVIALRDGEERESISGGDAFAGVRGLFLKSTQALNDALDALGRFGAREAMMALTIRRLYARLITLAAQAGHPRLPAQTPFEFQSTLIEVYPAHQTRIIALTRAYADVHYGELPDDPGLIDDARAMISALEGEKRA